MGIKEEIAKRQVSEWTATRKALQLAEKEQLKKEMAKARAASLVIKTATALLEKIDDITTEDFSKGGERVQREALREALAAFNKSKE